MSIIHLLSLKLYKILMVAEEPQKSIKRIPFFPTILQCISDIRRQM